MSKYFIVNYKLATGKEHDVAIYFANTKQEAKEEFYRLIDVIGEQYENKPFENVKILSIKEIETA